jgi:tetratricopeptide (TPR) repeat protein
MTNQLSFIIKLKKLLPLPTWSWAISALTQDRYVWKLLHNPEFGDVALDKIGANPHDWTPANLGLVRLGLDPQRDQLILDSKIRKEALITYESFLKGHSVELQEEQIIEQGLLIATALLEHQRLSDSWGTISSDLKPIPRILWQTSIGCLYGIVPDKPAFLSCLLSHDLTPIFRHAAIHAFLSNPELPSVQSKILQDVLTSQPMTEWAAILKDLEKYRPQMVTELAKHLLSKQPTFANRKKCEENSEQVRYLSNLITLSELERMAGQKEQGKTLHTLAISAVQDLHDQLNDQTIEVTIGTGHLDEAIIEWENRGFTQPTGKSNDASNPPPENLILSLLEKNRTSDALELLLTIADSEPTQNNPAYYLIKAHQSASEGDLTSARKAAKQAFIDVIEQIKANKTYLNSEIKSDQINKRVIENQRLLMTITRTLIDLDLPEQSKQIAQILAERCPNDAEVLNLLAQAHTATGELSIAVNNAHLATALQEDRLNYRQQLALCLQAADRWDEALAEWQSLLDKRFSKNNEEEWPTISILHNLANCANKAGDYTLAKDTCQSIIEREPQDGIAHTLLGETFLYQGDMTNALVHYQKGTELASHKAIPWLKLANAQLEKGVPGNAVDTLRQAVQAVPEDPIVHLTLAEIYLKENALTQALTSLQHARGLVTQPLLVSKSNPWEQRENEQHAIITIDGPLPCQVTMLLGETLRRLGHLDEARQVLEDAYEDYPGSIDLAQIYAKTLLSLGDHELAVEPLKMVVNSNPAEVEPYLDYAGILLTIKSQSDEAVLVLRKAQEISANDPRTKALLAEALAESGDLETSQQTFYQALQSDLSKDEKWHSRLSFGLGKVSLRLSQPETAIASLQESIRTNPDNPLVYQALANAFATLELKDEAIEAGQNAVRLSSDNLDMLIWYSSLTTKMGILNEAITSLEKYVDIKPSETGMIVQLGKIQLQAGRENEARRTFKQILAINEAGEEDLHKAAVGLLQLNDADSAATLLERAISKSPQPDSQLLLDLANAYNQAGRSHQALETLDKAINLDDQNQYVYLAKSYLLANLGRTDEVKDCLESALKLHPEDPNLRHHLVHVQRAAGDISNALANAVKLISTFRELSHLPDEYAARTLAADLARAMLKPTYARSFLLNQADEKSSTKDYSDQNIEEIKVEQSSEEDFSKNYTFSISVDKSLALFSHFCLAAELALDEGEEVAAAEALNKAIDYNPGHPRLFALQARLANRQGDVETAAEFLQNAIESVIDNDYFSQFTQLTTGFLQDGEELSDGAKNKEIIILQPAYRQRQESVCTMLGITAAAVELGKWEPALDILQKLVDETEPEPYTNLQIARTLVLQAEYQSLCQFLDVIEHAPGQKAVGNEASQAFQNAIEAVAKGLKLEELHENDISNQIIYHWLKRGFAAFNISEDSQFANQIQLNNDITRFYSNSVVSIDEDTVENYEFGDKSKDPLQHSLSLAYTAIAIEKTANQKEELEQGIQAAELAVNRYPKLPIFHALLANLSMRSEDYSSALNSMLAALSIWPDEPRWQATTAKIHLRCGNTQTAIEHLNKAVELEPGYMKHYLDLGEGLLINGDHQLAIESLKQAHRLEPEELEVNLALARAYIMNHDPQNATTFAEKAMRLEPNTPEPLQLLAEVALQSGDPKTALNSAKNALQYNPDHPDTLCLMARALSRMNQIDEALSVLETAVPLSSNPLPILLERAKLIETSQGSATALNELQELVRDYPNDPAVLASLARNLAAEGHNQEAIQAAQSALQRKEGNWEPGEQAKLYLLLGSLLRQSGQLDQAIYQLTEAIRLSPQEVEPYLELAATQQDRRQHVLALQTYHKAIEVAPKNPLPYYQASLALKDGRDYEGAERMLRKAANLAPNDVSIHRQLAALIALNLVHNQRSIPIEA